MSMTEQEVAYERAQERHRRNANRCQCRGDMPGRCPGPENCPCVDREEEEA